MLSYDTHVILPLLRSLPCTEGRVTQVTTTRKADLVRSQKTVLEARAQTIDDCTTCGSRCSFELECYPRGTLAWGAS